MTGRRKGLRYECMCNNSTNLNTIFQNLIFILLFYLTYLRAIY